MSSFLTHGRTLTSSCVLCAAVLCASFLSHGECQVTPAPPVPCSAHKDCETCVPQAQCLWCLSSNNCTEYPVSWLLPPPSVCRLSQARWGVCWMNFEALVIVLGVLGGSVVVGVGVCCCCCCRSCSRCRSRPSRDEESLTRRREEIRQHADERKMERKERQDEIRRKYGLIRDKDHPYSKFENE